MSLFKRTALAFALLNERKRDDDQESVESDGVEHDENETIGYVFVRVIEIRDVGRLQRHGEVVLVKCRSPSGEESSCTVHFDPDVIAVRQGFLFPVSEKLASAQFRLLLENVNGEKLRRCALPVWDKGGFEDFKDSYTLEGTFTRGGSILFEKTFLANHDKVVHSGWLCKFPRRSGLLERETRHAKRRFFQFTQHNQIKMFRNEGDKMPIDVLTLVAGRHVVAVHDKRLVIHQRSVGTRERTWTLCTQEDDSVLDSWAQALAEFAPKEGGAGMVQELRAGMIRQWHGHWDVVMTWPEGDTKHAHLRNVYFSRMKKAGLIIAYQKSTDGKFSVAKITAGEERLLEEADNLQIEVRVRRPTRTSNQLERARQRTKSRKLFGRVEGWKLAPVRLLRNMYDGIMSLLLDPTLSLGFAKFQLAKKSTFQPSHPRFFNSMDRQRLIHSIVTAPKFRHGAGVPMSRALHDGVFTDCFPLHNDKDCLNISREWFEKPWWTITQPINEIRDYLGVRMAFYFAFLEYFTRWMFYLSVFGLAAFIVMCVDNFNLDHPIVIGYSVVVILWCTLFVEFWKREESVLCLEFGMTDFKQVETERPDFVGERVHGRMTKAGVVKFQDVVGHDDASYFQDPHNDYLMWFSPIKRLGYIMFGAPVLFTFFVCCIVAAAGIVMLRTVLQVDVEGGGYVGALPYAFTIFALGTVYEWVAVRLNRLENWRTETEYENALIAKTFCFQFINNYIGLFFIAFVKRAPLPAGVAALSYSDRPVVYSHPIVFDQGRREDKFWYCYGDSCMEDMFELLLMLVVVRMLGSNVVELVWPFIKQKVSECLSKQDESKLPGFERQCLLDPPVNSFGDYLELMIQFGYVTLFAQAFPLASVAVVINNLLEIRIDGSRTLLLCKRPFYSGASSIGTWQSVLSVLSFLAVTTNCALITVTSEVMKGTPIDIVTNEKEYTDCVGKCEWGPVMEASRNETAAPQNWLFYSLLSHDLRDSSNCLSRCSCRGLCLSPYTRFMVFIFAEHSIVLFKLVCDMLIPDVPSHVARTLAWTELVQSNQLDLLKGTDQDEPDAEEQQKLVASWDSEDQEDMDMYFDDEQENAAEMRAHETTAKMLKAANLRKRIAHTVKDKVKRNRAAAEGSRVVPEGEGEGDNEAGL